MKVVDFLKRFEELKYDNDTDLEILLIKSDFSPEFLQIESINNNADCMGYNEIGIVVLEDEGCLV